MDLGGNAVLAKDEMAAAYALLKTRAFKSIVDS
jgi:hypothetical protein